MSEMHFFTLTEQVAEHLRRELIRGNWSGTMPGAIALAKELDIHRNTVEAALRQLEEDGLLVAQGPGRRRKIVLPEGHAPPALRVALQVFSSQARGADYMIELRHLLEDAGHLPFYPDKTLLDLGMDVRRIARFVKKTEADAWVVAAASREVLDWFAKGPLPAFALFGRMKGVPIAGMKPNKAPALAAATRYLIGQGHRRISFLCRRLHRLPQPGRWAQAFLSELETAGVPTGAFNLPDWEESKEGFGNVLDSLFGRTPPTALILDQELLYHAAHHHLAKLGLRMPEDVSLICTDRDPGFEWCDPGVAHIHWDYRPVVRRVQRWANNVALGKDDRRQSFTKAEFIEGGTVGRCAVSSGHR